MNRETIFNHIKEIVRKAAPTAETLLHDTETTSEVKEDSDIGILVLLDKDEVTIDDEAKISWPLYELEVRLRITIKPHIMPRIKWESRPSRKPFHVDMATEGVLL